MEKRGVVHHVDHNRSEGLEEVFSLSSPLFLHLSDAEKALLVGERATIQNHEKDSYVFQQGDKPEELYVLIRGAVQIEKVDVNGKKSLLSSFRKPGTVFAEVYLYLGVDALDYDCRCIEETRILHIPKAIFAESVDGKSDVDALRRKLSENLLVILSQKAYYLNQKLIILSRFSLRQKVATYLLRDFDLQETAEGKYVRIPYSRQELADYLGATRPALSRELIQMQEDGLIEYDRNQIRIVDRVALEALI